MGRNRIFKLKDWAKAKGIMREIMKKIIQEDLTPILDKIIVPTLIVWGKKDNILPAKDAFLLKEKIPNAKVLILPKNFHSPHLEDPENLAKIIHEFIISLSF